jgi:mannose-binding lectin 2
MRAAALLLAAAGGGARAFSPIPELSLRGPFTAFDGDGMRRVDGWALGGTAAVHENFVRLTNDRQSKRASAWATARLDREEWSATVRFRVSGQGKKLFGDGLALWFTGHSTHKDGTLHGFTDTFKGFGVVLDTCGPGERGAVARARRAVRIMARRGGLLTHPPPPPPLSFVNTEPGHVHKDIQVVVSDGSAPTALAASPVGCAADFRYWEGRDDFSVTRSSALRVRFSRGVVSAWIDAHADGNWKECFTGVTVPGMDAWFGEGAWLGLTATTGDLADNHDILSVLVGPEDEVAPNPRDEAVRPELVSSGNEDVDRAIRSAIALETFDLHERVAFLEHHFEYE